MNAPADNSTTGLSRLSPAELAALPPSERILDRLAEVLLAADEVLEMLHGADAVAMYWIEPSIQGIYDETNTLMKRLCD